MSKPVAAPHTLLIKHPASLTGCQVEIALCLAGADNKVVKRAHPAHVNTLLEQGRKEPVLNTTALPYSLIEPNSILRFIAAQWPESHLLPATHGVFIQQVLDFVESTLLPLTVALIQKPDGDRLALHAALKRVETHWLPHLTSHGSKTTLADVALFPVLAANKAFFNGIEHAAYPITAQYVADHSVLFSMTLKSIGVDFSNVADALNWVPRLAVPKPVEKKDDKKDEKKDSKTAEKPAEKKVEKAEVKSTEPKAEKPKKEKAATAAPIAAVPAPLPAVPVVPFEDENSDPYDFNLPTNIKLPQEGKRNILITSALPYVNNVPHLGNIIGCVLSADVFSRYCRARGYNSIYVCGTDEYGTATETKALQEGCTPQQICDKYFRLHRRIYKWFDIDFDVFGRTSTPKQTEIAQEIFRQCEANGHTQHAEQQQLYCTKCERFLADRFVHGICPTCSYADARGDQCDACGRLLNANELVQPACTLCHTTPEIRSTKHIFLDLPALQPRLESWIDEASVKGAWSLNSIQVTKHWTNAGLRARCITRDLKWGVPVPVPGFENKVFYVWFDAPIGYISITAWYTDQWRKWWHNQQNVQLYQFMGKDNIPFHTVIFPCTLLGTSDPYTMLHHISTTEYLNYEGGKFSKSRSVGVFGDNAIETGIPSEVWRYYLLVNRPETADTVFLWDDFAAKNNTELLNCLGNLVNRALSFVARKMNGVLPPKQAELSPLQVETKAKVDALITEYFTLMEQVHLKDSLKAVMAIARIGNEYMQLAQPWTMLAADPLACGTALHFCVNLLRCVCALIQPFMPAFTAKCATQLNLPLSAFDLHFTELTIDEVALPVGHTLGEIVPIFRRIDAAEVDALRLRYAGSQVQAAQSATDASGATTQAKDTKELIYSNAIEFPLDLQVGVVRECAPVPDSDKLYILQVDMGGSTRQIVSGLQKHYTAEQLVNKRCVVVCNLKPVKFVGVQSNGMVLTAVQGETLSILSCDDSVAPGTKVAPKGSKVVIQAKFDLKKQLPLLPFAVVDQKVQFANLPLQAGNPHAAQENPDICALVTGDAKIM